MRRLAIRRLRFRTLIGNFVWFRSQRLLWARPTVLSQPRLLSHGAVDAGSHGSPSRGAECYHHFEAGHIGIFSVLYVHARFLFHFFIDIPRVYFFPDMRGDKNLNSDAIFRFWYEFQFRRTLKFAFQSETWTMKYKFEPRTVIVERWRLNMNWISKFKCKFRRSRYILAYPWAFKFGR